MQWDRRGFDLGSAETLPLPSCYLVFEHGLESPINDPSVNERADVSGVHTGRFARSMDGHGRVFGLKFQPGGLFEAAARTAVNVKICIWRFSAIYSTAIRYLKSVFSMANNALVVPAATVSIFDSYDEFTGRRPPLFRLPPTAHIGRVRLAVSNLERSVAFYTEVIGLHVLRENDGTAYLGIREDSQVLLELEELPEVNALGRRTRLGLYHVAFLLPSRAALGSFLRHLYDLRVEFGAGDHMVSEALYLVDPDGINVEVYADRNRDEWRTRNGELVTGTQSVRPAEILASAREPWSGAPSGTTIGHLHLYVDDLKRASAFYHAALGLDMMTWSFPGALFLGAGGYHHHIGLNVWAAGSPVARENDARMLFWELVLPDQQTAVEVAESLLRAGFGSSPDGDRMFCDPLGICMKLVLQQVMAIGEQRI